VTATRRQHFRGSSMGYKLSCRVSVADLSNKQAHPHLYHPGRSHSRRLLLELKPTKMMCGQKSRTAHYSGEKLVYVIHGLITYVSQVRPIEIGSIRTTNIVVFDA
jgi:hypothetical protein